MRRNLSSRGFSPIRAARSTTRRASRRLSAAIERLESRTMLTVDLTGMPDWIEQGPGPITNGNNVLGIPDKPQAGAVNAVAIDPNNPNHVFAATVDGGIWRTSNFQADNPFWTPMTDSLPSLAIGGIQFEPLAAPSDTL